MHAAVAVRLRLADEFVAAPREDEIELGPVRLENRVAGATVAGGWFFRDTGRRDDRVAIEKDVARDGLPLGADEYVPAEAPLQLARIEPRRPRHGGLDPRGAIARIQILAAPEHAADLGVGEHVA